MDTRNKTKNIKYTPEMMHWWLVVIDPSLSLMANVKKFVEEFEIAFDVQAKSRHSVYVNLAKNADIRKKAGLKPIDNGQQAAGNSNGTKVAPLVESPKPRLRDKISAWFQ